MELTYKNKGMGITIGSMPFVLQQFKQDNAVNINSVKGINQDGMTYLGENLDTKNITIGLTITANTAEGKEELRRAIYRVFSPKLGQGTLVYKDDYKERKIQCIPVYIPYPTEENILFEKYAINLVAYEPYWTDMLETRIELAGWINDTGFHFPLSIDETTGVHFGYRDTVEGNTANCFNKGDVSTPIRVVFKSRGIVVNPKITNNSTGEFIQLNKSLTTDETIEITTDYSKKRVTSIMNSIETNAFNLINLDSTFMELQPGDNLFSYTATEGVNNLECYVYYYNRYLGV